MATEPQQPVMFEFEAVIQIRGAKTIQEAEKEAELLVGVTNRYATVARVNTDTYPEIFVIDEDGKEVEAVPDYEVERYDETENKWRDDEDE